MHLYTPSEDTPLLQSGIPIAMSPTARSETDETLAPGEASELTRRWMGRQARMSDPRVQGAGNGRTTGRSTTGSADNSSLIGDPHTQVHLSVDKVSFLYSPKSPNHGSFHDGSSTCASDDELSILDPYFDVTTARLRMTFDEAQPDGNDQLSYEGFKVALEGMGIRCADEAAFQKLVESIDAQRLRKISFVQFDAAVHKLKLVHLLEESVVARMIPFGYMPAAITVSDISTTRLQQFTLRPNDFSDFFMISRPAGVSVRWINMNGHDSLNLKRLAIKYRLHPLAVEDTLEMHERPKFDRYDGHLFLVFPLLRMEAIQEKYSDDVRRRKRTLSLTNVFKMDKPFTTAQRAVCKENEAADAPFKLWIEHIAIFVVGNNTVITVKDGDESRMWRELNRRLMVPYSKLRHNDAKFLTYAVLDVIVDQITDVVDSISDSLMMLEEELERSKHSFSIGRLRSLKNELFRLPRLLKPAREVLKNLIEGKDFDETATAYIRDVHDHIVQVLDDIDLQLTMCRLLTEDYRDAKANHINYVIYTLTIVTTVFLPAQFLTGVYGMNFENMPELHTRYGYAMFWVLVIAIAVGLQFYFRHKKWI